MPKVTESELVGREGINHIAGVCRRMGYLWRQTPNSEVGFDGEIEIRVGDDGTAQNIKVQSKAGQSYLRNDKPDRFDFYSDANAMCPVVWNDLVLISAAYYRVGAVVEVCSFQVPELHDPCWAGPVLSRKRLCLRSEIQLICFDLRR